MPSRGGYKHLPRHTGYSYLFLRGLDSTFPRPECRSSPTIYVVQLTSQIVFRSSTGPAVEKELNYALGKEKLIIPIVEQGVGNPAFLRKFRPIFRFSRFDDNPGAVESQVLEFLKRQKLDKESRQALGALIAIGMGLLLLSGLAKE